MKYVREGDFGRYTFASFCPGEANAHTVRALTEAAEHPGVYSPVYLCGPVGTGKSHLLRAVADRMLDAKPDAHIEIISSGDLINRLVALISCNEGEKFRELYAQADALLVDDIQFLAGKEATQQEMRILFDTLIHSGKQVVLTADRPPREILALDDSLISRFRGGMLLELTGPDRNAREEIVRQYARDCCGQILAPAVVAFLAGKINSVRSLQGATAKLCISAKMAGGSLPMEEVPGITRLYWDSVQRG